MKKIISILLLTATLALGQEESPITPRDAVVRALQTNSSLSVQRYEPELRKADVVRERGYFDPTFTAGMGVQSLGLSNGTNYRVGLQHRLGFGASYSIEHSSGTNSLGQSGGRTSINLRVPLLRGAGGEVTRAGVNNALGVLEISQLQLQMAAYDLASEVESAYWSLRLAQLVAEVRVRAVGQAETFLDMLKTEIDAGAAAPYELYEAEQNLASRQADVKAAEGDIELARQILLRLLGQQGSDLKLDEFMPEVELAELKDYEEQALANRPLLKVSEKEIDLLGLQERVARNNAAPQLDLVAGHTLDGGGSLGPSWQAGLQLRIPIGNRDGKGRLRRARTAHEQAEARMEDLRQRVLLEVAQSYTSVQASTKQLEASERASVKAQERVEAESERFSSGFTPAHKVIFAQQQQLNNDELLMAARIRRQLAMVGLRRATGTILNEVEVDWQSCDIY